jgi:hypothetical protein
MISLVVIQTCMGSRYQTFRVVNDLNEPVSMNWQSKHNAMPSPRLMDYYSSLY